MESNPSFRFRPSINLEGAHLINYWGYERQMLLRNQAEKDASHRLVRETVYELIREKTGLPFSDFGDDVDRWLQWLNENDTEDPAEISRRRKRERSLLASS